jgi:hypothetical protein
MTRSMPPQDHDHFENQVSLSFFEPEAPQQEQDRTLGRLIYECGLLLRLGGLALIGVYLVLVLTQLFPLQLLKPQWQLDGIASLCGAGSFALEGALFILVAERLDVISPANFLWSSRIRHLALPAGLGFLLLIPLHMSATQRLIGQQKLEDQKLLIHLQDTKHQIADAQSPQALQNAIIPLQLNPAPAIPANPATFQLIRNSLLRDLEPQLTRIQDAIQEKQKNFASAANKTLLKNSLVSLLYGAVFLAITATASGRRMVPEEVVAAGPTD